MDLKQAYISLGWKIDDTNLKKAKEATDSLVDTIRKNGVAASNTFGDSFKGISNKIDSTKDKVKNLVEAQKSLNDISIDRPSRDMDGFTNRIDKSIGAVSRLKDKMESIEGGTIRGPQQETVKSASKPEKSSGGLSLGKTVIGGAVGGLVGSAVGSFTGYISNMAKTAFKADQAAQSVQLAWHTMGVKSTADVASLTSQIGDMTKQANISGADTTAVQKNLYNATNGNIDQTKALTNEMFAFGKATGQSDDQIVQATGSLGRLFNTTKVRANTFSRITKQMPAMRDAIIKASGESSAKFMADMNAGKISGSELRDLMVKAASQSGDAWKKYGDTAAGAMARLQGTQTQLWKDTMKGMAGDANQGLIQLSNLFAKNEKPISQMMAGIGNGLTKIASGAINFLVQNQKPLGSIAQSLVSIVGTIGNAVWGTFSTIVKGIGDAFGIVSGNSKKSQSPMQTFADIMKDIAAHKDAIKFVATTLTGMFVAKKALAFASSLREVASSIGLVNAAEAAGGNGGKGGKGSFLSNLIGYGTTPGGFKRAKPTSLNRASESFTLKGDESSLADNLSGATLGDLKSVKNGAFRTSSVIADGEYASKLGRFGKLAGAGSLLFGGTKLGSLIDKGGAGIARGLTKVGGFAKSSPVLSKLGGAVSKVPFLDIAAAGTNLIGMNHKNAGNKIGGSVGMLGGSVLGGMFGGPIGAMVGGWLGQSIGGPVGNFMQKKLPGIFSKGWDTVKSGTGKAISVIGTGFKKIGPLAVSAWDATKSKISSAWGGLKSIASKTWSGTKNVFQSGMKGLSSVTNSGMKAVSNVFQHSGPVIKGIAKGISVGTNDYFQGMFKTANGIFKAGSDLINGRWSNLGSDLKQIGSGIMEALEAPFKGAWAAIQSIVSDISGAVKSVMSSIASMGSKVANIARHPIKSIESMFATGTTSRYPQGLPKTTRAVVNDGTGPELIHFGNGYGMYKGRNVHTVLPKGSHVYNANDTRKLVGEHHFAGGTTRLNTNIKIGKNNLASSISDTAKNANRNFTRMSRALNNQNTQMHNKMFKTTSDSAKKINANNQRLSDKTISNFTDMGKQLNPIWSKTVAAFGNYFNQLGPSAKSSMQGAVDSLNGGITGIDKTLEQFGGNDSVISPIHYANGTNGVANQDHTAIVNDAKTGPQTEAIVNQDGGTRYVSGTNAKTVIRKGESVLTGADTLTAINQGLIPHYAKGKSSKAALRSLAKNNAKHSRQAFNTEFTNNIQLTGSGLRKGLTKMASNASASENNGYKWSNAMWKVINNAVQDSMGTASGLLAAVEKYGTGKKYVWGATGPDAFDCSGLVQYALKTAFGINYPRTSGAQIAKASGISRSDAQPGDLIGNSEHIGVVADKGAHHYFSAFNPSSNPNILMTPVNGTYFPGTPKFGRVSGIKSKNDDSNSSSGIKGVSSQMQKLVTAELGSSALSAITKKLSDNGASGNPAGDGVNRWKPDVVKALGALHLSTSTSMVQRVLRQINTESSGNPDAVGGTDGLSDGKAMGLMQVKPGTFAQYGKPSLGKWNNGYASLYAGLNYAKHRYGDSLSFLGNGHGYANGGRPQVGETAWVGEKGPELVHFDSPTTISSNVKSVSALRRSKTDNSSKGSTVNIARGAVNVTVKESKNATATAKEVGKIIEQKLHKLFGEAAKDLQGGTA